MSKVQKPRRGATRITRKEYLIAIQAQKDEIEGNRRRREARQQLQDKDA